MKFLLKLLLKFGLMAVMIVVLGGGLRRGTNFMSKVPGMPDDAKFSSEESDLMSTVMQSAVKLFTGQAKKEELAAELSDQLYAGRGSAEEMSELGIEMTKPGGPSPVDELTGGAKARPGAVAGKTTIAAAGQKPKPGASPVAKAGVVAGKPGAATSPAERLASGGKVALPPGLWGKLKPYSFELGLAPVVFLGMLLVQRFRGRRNKADPFNIPAVAVMAPAETAPYEMKHDVHTLGSEEFELLVALIYQRQGYRVSMPAGMSGGRGGDFTLQRKSEKLLVQCKKLTWDHKVPVDRVRELKDAMKEAGATRALYVASCGFSWDARNFAKANGVTLISSRTLDELLKAAKENPEEDLLAVSTWVPKLMTKLQMTPPVCPSCEAPMDEINVSHGTTWLCSQRPECRGRRSARKYQKPPPASARKAEALAEEQPVAAA